MGFSQLLMNRKNQIDEELKHALSQEHAFAAPLKQAMLHSLLAGGKRLRPILVLETIKLFGGDEVRGINSALAIEILHTFTLIHDDLPCMDDDDYRRGIITCHKKFGEDVAVLAGDALIFSAYDLLSRPVAHLSSDLSLQIISLISRALGMQGVIGGQYADLKAEHMTANPEMLKFIHRHKTAELLMVSVDVGGIIGEATEEERDKMRGVAECLGMAFQITDDILNVMGDQQVLGKPIGSDKVRGKMTYPAMYGLDASKNQAAEQVRLAKELLVSMPHLNTQFFELLADQLLTRSV